MTEIKGIVAALQTPMYEDGSINEGELRRQVRRQIAAGVDASPPKRIRQSWKRWAK